MAKEQGRRTFVTEQQAVVHALFVKHRSMSVVARALDLSQIRVREALVQYQRNGLRDRGLDPPPLREMLRGDVTTRFGVPREELNGRPAKHLQRDPDVSGRAGGTASTASTAAATAPSPSQSRAVASSSGGVRRLIVTAAEPGAPVHEGFWHNLRAYGARLGAEVVVIRLGSVDVVGAHARDFGPMLSERLEIAGAVDVAADVRIPSRLPRPLEAQRHRSSARWSLFGHPAVQLETLPRVRAEGLRVQMTTGAVTLPRRSAAGPPRGEVGAVVVEVAADGTAHCRHLLAAVDGDGSFQDLTTMVSDGSVSTGGRVEALHFGDVHHAHLDPVVAAATWGIGRAPLAGRPPLVDVLRPRNMLFHDVCDFDARSHHDARDHHKRFAQSVAGGGDVRRELAETARFLAETRRPWATSVVVRSNHDEMLMRWLRESDFREDPVNTLFFLETSLALHRRLAAGGTSDGMFEATLRELSGDGLRDVRFLGPGESLRIAGIENGIHGHQGADGRQGGMAAFERLGIKATIGHTHRPTTRDGVYCAGVCQTELAYARGPLTAWAVGHVVTYATGARQHLFFADGSFFA